jgi:hypothetical protein
LIDGDIVAPGQQSERKGRSRAGSNDCSISSENSDTKNKKKKRGRDGLFEGNEVPGDTGVQNEDFRLFETCFPKEYEPDFCTAVFELGLKHSSPKVLMSLMPLFTNLHSEHLKSHLQKYRIHHERSKDEFLAFYNEFMRDDFQTWEERKGWESRPVKKSNTSLTLVEPSVTNPVPLLEITNAATSIQNADNIASSSVQAPSPCSRSVPQVQSPTAAGGAKKPKGLAGYKNIVTQANQLYAEWRLLYEESVYDTSKIGTDYPNEYEVEQKFPKPAKGSRQVRLNFIFIHSVNVLLPHLDHNIKLNSIPSPSRLLQGMGMSLNYKDEPNGWSAGEGTLSTLSSDTMHNSYVPNSQHLANPNFGAGNCDVGNNMMYFGNSLPMLPLHSNPYGGYSNNYCHPSYPTASLHSLASQQHQHQQSLHIMATNSMSSLSSLSHAKSLNNMNSLNSNYHTPSDSFCPVPISSGHYMPSTPSLARVSSMDGSEDNTDNSSNGSNNANELLMNNLNANMINHNHPYFYAAGEVRACVKL